MLYTAQRDMYKFVLKLVLKTCSWKFIAERGISVDLDSVVVAASNSNCI